MKLLIKRLFACPLWIASSVDDLGKSSVEQILVEIDEGDPRKHSSMRLNSIACTALPTCSLALAESERYLPTLIDELDEILTARIREESIAIRSTSCQMAVVGRTGEIGLVESHPERPTFT